MGALERRLQLLLDDARYERISREAERSGISVNAVVRQAIDVAYPPKLDRRREAIAHLLAFESHEPADSEDAAWTATREAMETELVERFSSPVG